MAGKWIVRIFKSTRESSMERERGPSVDTPILFYIERYMSWFTICNLKQNKKI